MDVVEDSALVLEFQAQRLFAISCPAEVLAEFVVGLLQVFPMAGAVAEGFAGDEAEGGCEYHPDWYNCCCFVDDHALTFCWVEACSESTR